MGGFCLKWNIMMARTISKMGVIQIRRVAKSGGIVQIEGKCSKNKMNSKWGILQKIWWNLHMGDS